MASGNPIPPDGDFVLYLESSATAVSVTLPFALPASASVNPMWRFSVAAAQRKPTAGTIDRQIVRVEITIPGYLSNYRVYEDVIRDEVYRTHVTRPFPAPAASVGTITFTGTVVGAVSQAALLDKFEVREVLDFHDPTTWVTNSVPTQYDNIRIPADSCVGLRGAAWVNTIDVVGELLVPHGPTASTLFRLASRSVNVRTATALFQVGTEGVPFTSRFDLVLDHDAGPTVSPPDADHPDINGLRVFDRGWVEMHGLRRTSWVRLGKDAVGAGEDALPGAMDILVEPVPDWVAGDRIVITSSDRDYRHAEEALVNAVTPTGTGAAWITIAQVVQHFHCGQLRKLYGNFNPPRELSQRAEVGLLSHNVRIVGQPRTSNSANVGYGGHVMIEDDGYALAPGGPTGVDGGFGRFSGVELDNMGRKGQFGRYPLHWHTLIKQGRGQFMKNSSIHHSNNRVVAVHLTDGIRFEGNVCYQHPGHGVFIEDGSEENNEFLGNLVLGTRVPDVGFALLGSDMNNRDGSARNVFQNRSPASFWITNPNNIFRDNVAAGSEGVSYWFALPKRPMGLSHELVIAQPPNPYVVSHLLGRFPPNQQVLGAFENNVCHSSWIGFDVHDGIDVDNPELPKTTDIVMNQTWKPSQVQILTDFGAYACNVALYTGNGDKRLRFQQAILSDNRWNLVMASHDIVDDSAIVLDAGSGLGLPPSPPGTPGDPPLPRTAIGLYDGASELHDLRLFGFHQAGPAGNELTTFQGLGGARKRTNARFSGIRCYSTLTSTQAVAPYAGDFQDYANETNPREWGVAIDNWDHSLISGAASAANASTLVSRHPMMLTGYPAINEFDVPNTGSPARLLSSRFRFGYLRTFLLSDRTENRYASLRYTRELVQGSSVIETKVWEDHSLVDPYRQIAIIADRAGEDNKYRYVLDWRIDPVQPPDVAGIQLSGLQVGDSVLVGFLHYVAPPFSIVKATQFYPGPDAGDPNFSTATVPINSTSGGLPGLGPGIGATSWYHDSPTSTLWIRIKIAAGDLANQQGDGLGQALRVTR
jgi:hypothetical protein